MFNIDVLGRRAGKTHSTRIQAERPNKTHPKSHITSVSSTPADGVTLSGLTEPEQKKNQQEALPDLPLVCLEASTKGVLGPLAVPLLALKDAFGSGQRESRFEHRATHQDEGAAVQSFEQARKKLLNPNQWKELGPSFGAAQFQLIDQESAEPTDRTPKKGDYLKIRLPDGLSPSWVQIEELQSQPDLARLVVRPSSDPQQPDKSKVQHLFDRRTTNVFEIKRDGLEVVASVEGRQEKANTDGGLLDRKLAKLRTAGAWMGAKKPQWIAFTRNLLTEKTRSSPLALTSEVTAKRVAHDLLAKGGGTRGEK